MEEISGGPIQSLVRELRPHKLHHAVRSPPTKTTTKKNKRERERERESLSRLASELVRNLPRVTVFFADIN